MFKKKTEDRKVTFKKKNLIICLRAKLYTLFTLFSSYVSYRDSGIRTGTISRQRNGYNRRHGTGGRRARRGFDGFENNFQVRLSTGFVSMYLKKSKDRRERKNKIKNEK